MSQIPMFQTSASAYTGRLRFDGPGLTVQDEVALTKSLQKAYDYLADGQWHLLSEMADALGITEQGASARCRDLRKPRNGGHDVVKERVPGAARVWRYRLVKP